jgi:hypothetical protein
MYDEQQWKALIWNHGALRNRDYEAYIFLNECTAEQSYEVKATFFG